MLLSPNTLCHRQTNQSKLCNYLCGVEGGSTSMEVVIMTDEGEECSKVAGPPVNQWQIGISEAVVRTLVTIDLALHEADLPPDTKFLALGLALSGVDSKENALAFENELRKIRPTLSDQIYVCNDCLGTLFSVTDQGGVVLIAGTGSNCKLVHKDLVLFGVGGHGHMLGDEGSAYWITHQAIKTYLDNDEGLVLTPYDTSNVKEAIFNYYNLKSNVDLLHPHYHFQKNHYSGLCKILAQLAYSGDALCKNIFYNAGYLLGAHVMAVLRKSNPQFCQSGEGVTVVCRGGVFKSWDLLKEGFRDRVVPDMKTSNIAASLRLALVTSSVATGAALLAAHVKLNLSVPRKHKQKILAEFHS